MNCSEIQGVTSSVFVHPLFAFCRHSPQLILRLYYVHRGHQPWEIPSPNGANFAEPIADHPGVDWFDAHYSVCRYESRKCSQLLDCPSLGKNLSDCQADFPNRPSGEPDLAFNESRFILRQRYFWDFSNQWKFCSNPEISHR